jgi:spoIIIJ-associated protein
MSTTPETETELSPLDSVEEATSVPAPPVTTADDADADVEADVNAVADAVADVDTVADVDAVADANAVADVDADANADADVDADADAVVDGAAEEETVAPGPAAAQEDDGTEDEAVAAAPARTEQLVREGEIAADFLEGLLDIADLSGDLEVDIEGNRAAIAIVDSEDGAAPRRLVGPGGQVLDALQELTRLAVQAETGERSRLMLDVAGYRADRRSALVRSARQAITEVKESGRRRELEPMTAFERKVVHDEVLAAGLHSESEGTEPSRYVVILPPA